GALRAMVATAPQAMPSFDHPDTAFASDTPALPAPKPSLSFMRAPRRCFPSGPRQDNASHPAAGGRLFIGGRGESTITSSDVRGTIEHRDMPIQRGRPQRHVGRTSVVHLVGGDDLMLGFL